MATYGHCKSFKKAWLFGFSRFLLLQWPYCMLAVDKLTVATAVWDSNGNSHTRMRMRLACKCVHYLLLTVHTQS